MIVVVIVAGAAVIAVVTAIIVAVVTVTVIAVVVIVAAATVIAVIALPGHSTSKQCAALPHDTQSGYLDGDSSFCVLRVPWAVSLSLFEAIREVSSAQREGALGFI